MKRGLKAIIRKAGSNVTSVATFAPMKRGLKATDDRCARGGGAVATFAPMKRGLKVEIPINTQPLLILCSNLCPDEKGTESQVLESNRLLMLSVATFAPMKRGLKELPGDGRAVHAGK